MVTARRGFCAAYLGTVTLFIVGSFFPGTRLWGAASWGYYSVSARWIVVGLALAAPLVALWLARKQDESRFNGLMTRWWVPGALVLAAIFLAAFYFGRNATHFLGDGSTALANLASETPIIKDRGLGEGLLHFAMAKLLGRPSETHALISYQAISIAAGLLFVLVVLGFAGKLFTGTLERLLFSLGCCTGGYMLLYFGYVENYSLFVLSVLVFTVLGVLIIRRKLPRWLILIPAAAAIFLHIFGVALVPATLYVLLIGTRVSRSIAHMRPHARLLLAIALLIVIITGVFVLYQTSYFFRIALLTPATTTFTVSGYTLFSLNHLADLMSLLFLLFPALAMAGMMLSLRSVRRLFKLAEFQFLSVTLAFSLVIAFIFDPKLGMPRDWDLFSFVGVPLTVAFYSLLLDKRAGVDRRGVWAAGAIVLSLLVLGARVGIQATPPLALQQIADYIQLDPIKGKHAILFLTDYYKERGDSVSFARWERAWQQYPDVQLLAQADSLLQRNDVMPAVVLLEKAAASNPMSATAYAYLGSANVRVGRCKEALTALKIAKGLSPHNMQVFVGLGYAYYCLGDARRAESAFRAAARLGPHRAEPYFALAQYYRQLMQLGKYQEYLAQALRQTDASAPMWAELGDYYLGQKRLDKAADAFKRGLMRGLDTAIVWSRIRSQPELFTYLKQ